MNEHRVLMNITRSDWAVHFIAPNGRTRIGPWLLLDSETEVDEILRWGNPTTEDLESYRESMRRWNVASVPLRLSDVALARLIERGRAWPWTGYELRRMKERGAYPPKRLEALGVGKTVVGETKRGSRVTPPAKS